MTTHAPIIARRSPGPRGERIITLAALAVGGQGGGVLTGWIIDLAEANGYRAQSTSVAGVAQRTGATIYYVEMCKDTGRTPVFALSPSEGDVDIMIAAELMEAGRAVMRGFVTPGRTTLIASTHRIAAVSEKIVPGDGRVDAAPVIHAMGLAADQVVAFDMERMAVEAGSVISSSLFGALAGSGALPFPRDSYEAVIRRSGKGVEASLRAFALAHDRAKGHVPPATPEIAASAPPSAGVPARLQAEWQALCARLDHLPAPARGMAESGLRKVVDYQDIAYGAQYLDMVERAARADSSPFALTEAAAKYACAALCYDDLLRVADLKTRAGRLRRVRAEVRAGDDQVMRLTEYFHPRFDEFTTTLPARLGAWLQGSRRARALFARHLDKGRRIRTDSLTGFGMLWAVSALRPWRRSLLRHRTEMAHVGAWFDRAMQIAPTDNALAVEVLCNRRLIKGYSDTHARGLSKFDRVMSALPLLQGRPDAADWMRRLRKAALADEAGDALDGALRTVESFAA